MVAETDIERARDALAREAWAEAYERFSALDPALLAAEDLEGLADAAWWSAQLAASIAARQRAYTAWAAAGDDARAGWQAVRLAMEHFVRGEPAVGAGWLGRAHRHLDERPDHAESGLLATAESTIARLSGDVAGALALARRASAVAARVSDPNLRALASHVEGLALVATGAVPEGMRLLDDAMTSVIAGELGDYFTGIIYCNVIDACLQVADVGRAGEWSEAATAWCSSLREGSIFPGLCRVNRAEVASLRGAWPEAEAEALRATDEMMRFDPGASAAAFYRVGEIRRRLGDLAGAEEAFTRAHELGADPQPGLALLRFAQGRADAAHRALQHAATPTSLAPLRRAELLGARAEVAIAVGDLGAAERASEELAAVSARFHTPALEAEAVTARGAVQLAKGDAEGAVGALREAFSMWRELRLPYQAARARALLGRAMLETGDEEDGRLAIEAARSSLERLGAVWDADRMSRLLPAPTDEGPPRGLTPREVEVLRLVAAGRTNREIATTLVISEHTVARHLQNMFAKLDVSSRSAATAFAFEHGLA